MNIVVVVASATGRTRRMAEAFAEGAESEGASVTVLDAQSADAASLEAAHAIVLGCGVHMSGAPSAMRGFLERLAPQWMAGTFAGRIGAAFVTSGAGARGGGELVIMSCMPPWRSMACCS